jgi:hypothetical protein
MLLVDRSGMSGIRFAQYVRIKYTLAYWLKGRRLQRQREKLLMKAGVDAEPSNSNATWIEAAVDKNGSPARPPAGALRIHFATLPEVLTVTSKTSPADCSYP